MNNANPTPLDLQATAKQIMEEHGFEPDFPPQVSQQLSSFKELKIPIDGKVQDLRDLPWSSIDNDTSRDLDQIEVAERIPDGSIRVRVGIADVDSAVARNSPIDRHASENCTTVYTGVRNFSMLPDELSTDLTSLGEHADRIAMVVEFAVAPDGSVQEGKAYRALTRNAAQLAYNS